MALVPGHCATHTPSVILNCCADQDTVCALCLGYGCASGGRNRSPGSSQATLEFPGLRSSGTAGRKYPGRERKADFLTRGSQLSTMGGNQMAETEVRSQAHPSDRWTTAAKQIAIVIGGSAVIAVCARLVLPLPFTPVPLTLANFGVLLVGLALGSKRGFASACVYLAWGAMGLPVFSPSGVGGLAQLSGPTNRFGDPLAAIPNRKWDAKRQGLRQVHRQAVWRSQYSFAL